VGCDAGPGASWPRDRSRSSGAWSVRRVRADDDRSHTRRLARGQSSPRPRGSSRSAQSGQQPGVFEVAVARIACARASIGVAAPEAGRHRRPQVIVALGDADVAAHAVAARGRRVLLVIEHEVRARLDELGDRIRRGVTAETRPRVVRFRVAREAARVAGNMQAGRRGGHADVAGRARDGGDVSHGASGCPPSPAGPFASCPPFGPGAPCGPAGPSHATSTIDSRIHRILGNPRMIRAAADAVRLPRAIALGSAFPERPASSARGEPCSERSQQPDPSLHRPAPDRGGIIARLRSTRE
jgi:hypothetical protein